VPIVGDHAHNAVLACSDQMVRVLQGSDVYYEVLPHSNASSPHHYHIVTTSSPHRYHIVTTSLLHRYHIVTTSLLHLHHIVTTSLPYRYFIVTTSSPHRYYIVTISLLRGTLHTVWNDFISAEVYLSIYWQYASILAPTGKPRGRTFKQTFDQLSTIILTWTNYRLSF
jgi:hypothetical protein